MPISAKSPIRHACTMAPWPTVTSLPITVGKPPGRVNGPSWVTCTTVPSWMLVRGPISIELTSPRTTQPGQMETSSPRLTRPMTVAAGSTYTRAPRVGRWSRKGRMLMRAFYRRRSRGRPRAARPFRLLRMKIASWNVNSLNVRLPHLEQWLQAAAPDVVALQETKLDDERFPDTALAGLGYRSVFAGQKTYNGVA